MLHIIAIKFDMTENLRKLNKACPAASVHIIVTNLQNHAYFNTDAVTYSYSGNSPLLFFRKKKLPQFHLNSALLRFHSSAETWSCSVLTLQVRTVYFPNLNPGAGSGYRSLADVNVKQRHSLHIFSAFTSTTANPPACSAA
jgi:hypothetical protein